MTNFTTWLDKFADEKGLDLEQTMEVKGNSGTNFIPIGCLLEAIKSAPDSEQRGIKAMIIKIDFNNGDVLHYFKHLAQALAI